ncbi:MAG: hypothetical protein A4E73_03730 [Syntrophaceae bacterium PtaU1.Bin231]|nr:MAG: hypothetical protein A4E73_03730 [Syntrophaceae bacterium PtaU1.Bin231]
MPVTVVDPPLFHVAEDLVRLGRLLELLLRLAVPGVPVGVVLHGHAAVASLDFVGPGRAIDPQDLVVAAFHGEGGSAGFVRAAASALRGALPAFSKAWDAKANFFREKARSAMRFQASGPGALPRALWAC